MGLDEMKGAGRDAGESEEIFFLVNISQKNRCFPLQYKYPPQVLCKKQHKIHKNREAESQMQSFPPASE